MTQKENLKFNIDTELKGVQVPPGGHKPLVNLNTANAVTLVFEFVVTGGSLQILQNSNPAVLATLENTNNIYLFTTRAEIGNLTLNNQHPSNSVKCDYRFLGIAN